MRMRMSRRRELLASELLTQQRNECHQPGRQPWDHLSWCSLQGLPIPRCETPRGWPLLPESSGYQAQPISLRRASPMPKWWPTSWSSVTRTRWARSSVVIADWQIVARKSVIRSGLTPA